MGLLGLPLELFRDILALTVVSFSLEDDTQPRFVNTLPVGSIRLKGVMQLRLVNKLFEAELIGALVASKALDSCMFAVSECPFGTHYIERRALMERDEDYEHVGTVQKVARALVDYDCETDPDIDRQDTYVQWMVKLYRMLGPEIRFAIHFQRASRLRVWPEPPNPTEMARKHVLDGLLFAAAASNNLDLAKRTVSKYIEIHGGDFRGSSIFPSPYEVAALAGHHEVLDLLVKNSDGETMEKCRSRCLQLVAQAGSTDGVAFILGSDWGRWNVKLYDQPRFRRVLQTSNVECFELVRKWWEMMTGAGPLSEEYLLPLIRAAKHAEWGEMEQHLSSLLEQRCSNE